MLTAPHLTRCPDTDQACPGCIDEARYYDFSILMSEMGITEEREIEQRWENMPPLNFCPECHQVNDENTKGYCSEWCRWVNDED